MGLDTPIPRPEDAPQLIVLQPTLQPTTNASDTAKDDSGIATDDDNNAIDDNNDNSSNYNNNTKNNYNSNNDIDINNKNNYNDIDNNYDENAKNKNTTEDIDNIYNDNIDDSNSISNSNTNTNYDENDITDYKTDLMFTKKDLRKQRTQSFQSVLSSASLKSLKFQSQHPPTSANPTSASSNNPATTTNHRSNSTVSNSSNTVANFLSYIQAPVLSSIANLKSADKVEIGQQLPFVDTHEQHTSMASTTNNSRTVSLNNGDYDDQEIILQQQHLTMNALKKLSLSPMPIHHNPDDDPQPKSRTVSRKTSVARIPTMERISEPYQPAQVDLSTFSSLTRQNQSKEKLAQAPAPSKHAAGDVPLQQPHPQASLSQAVSQTHDLHLHSQSQQSNSNSHQSQSQSHPGQNQAPVQPQPLLQAKPSHFQPSAPTNANSSLGAVSGSMRSPAHPQGQNFTGNPPPASLATAQLAYHREVEMHQRALKAKIPAAVVPPQDMQFRRTLLLQAINAKTLEDESASQNLTNSSSNSHKHVQQIKGFRSPMYVPAVLRKTGSERGSTDKGHLGSTGAANAVEIGYGSDEGAPNAAVSNSSANGHLLNNSPPDEHLFSTSLLPASSRASVSSMESNSSLNNTSRLEHHHSRHTPTRRHWMKDESVSKCGIQACPKNFTFFERRHHCRKCGGIFCNEHTSHYLYINHLAQFTTGGRGTLSKVCDYCIEEYNEFIRQEFGVDITSTHSKNPRSANRSGSGAATKPTHAASAPSSHAGIFNGSDTSLQRQPQRSAAQRSISPGVDPKLPGHAVATAMLQRKEPARSEQLVGSVPANWSWSSF